MIERPGPSRRFFRPTWAEVDLSQINANLARFRRKLHKSTKLMFVVKANAYGHGAVACALAAQKAGGADWLGVSSVEEGVALREAGVKLPVLVLGSLYPFESFLAAAEYQRTPTVASLESARRLVEASSRVGRRLGCHLKIDTGMGRIGVSPAASAAVASFIAGRKSIRLEGVYTHLSSAESDRAFTAAQLSRFRDALKEMRAPAGALRHAANSVAALSYASARLDLVRPGGAIFGLCAGFSPVLSLKSKIVYLKTVGKGATVGYGATFKARRPTRVATIPVGYADGYARAHSNRGEVLVGGRRCPIIGRVSMDMLTADVSDVPSTRVGEDVVLIGRQGRQAITAEDLAKAMGTISYEVTCALSARVPRVYL
jgi:alanine racemase